MYVFVQGGIVVLVSSGLLNYVYQSLLQLLEAAF